MPISDYLHKLESERNNTLLPCMAADAIENLYYSTETPAYYYKDFMDDLNIALRCNFIPQPIILRAEEAAENRFLALIQEHGLKQQNQGQETSTNNPKPMRNNDEAHHPTTQEQGASQSSPSPSQPQ